MQEFGSTIDIEWNHNHSVQSLHSLSFKDVPTSVTLSRCLKVVCCLVQHIESFFVSLEAM